MSAHVTAQPQTNIRATIATVRDRWDRRVAYVEASPGAGELGIAFRLEARAGKLACKEALSSLANERFTMLLSGVLQLRCQCNGNEEIRYVDEFIARVSDCQLRLVYDREGINQALEMLEDIWS